jgi:hypothetical protein
MEGEASQGYTKHRHICGRDRTFVIEYTLCTLYVNVNYINQTLRISVVLLLLCSVKFTGRFSP